MEFVGTFWSLVPPIVAIVLALITKETYLSLFVGIVVGALLLAGFDPVATVNYIIVGETPNGDALGLIHAVSDPWNAGIFIFLVILGIMVAMINASGATAAFGKWAAKHIKSRVGTQLATFVLGCLLFIDDYFNCLTVGAVMVPVSDGNRLSRAKLAYVMDATAAPICAIAPVSSWAAAVSATAAELDTGITSIELFISTIPFNFYALISIVFIVGITVMGFDYGPMAKKELAAYRDGILGGNVEESAPVESTKARVLDLVLPIVALFVFSVVGMIYVGGFWDAESGNHMDLIGAFGDTDASVGLSWGAIITIIVTYLYFLARGVIRFEQTTDCIVNGFKAMVPALLILTFALTLKLATNALGASTYVAGLMESAAPGLYSFLPCVIFLVALGLAFATGTSWGTFGILIPIVVPIFASEPTLLSIGIAACLAGAVAGDHCSPISDTTVMASAGSKMNHIDHVSTQLPYVLTVCGISFVMFLIAGFVKDAFICLAVGLLLTIAVLFLLKNTVGKKSVEDYREVASK